MRDEALRTVWPTGSEVRMALHLRGVVLPDDQQRDLYVDGDRITLTPLAAAETVVDGGWLVPGLVDVHTHPGAEQPGDPLDQALLRRHGAQHRDAGVTLLRAPGSAARLPAWFGHDAELPRVQGAGPWLAAPGRFFPGWGRQLEPSALPDAAVEEAAASGGWCKLIADWSVGEGAERRYQPSLPAETLAEAVRRVHQLPGGRVAVHSQHGEGCAAAVAAGADSLEHGMHLATDLLDAMARQGTALVPTMLAFADVPERLTGDLPPAIRSWLAAGWARHPALVRAAHEAGVTVLAGTDSIGGDDSPHGQVAEEVRWLARAGMPAEAALGAGSWTARRWLGLPGLEEGAPADVVAYPTDPRRDLSVLHQPTRIVLRGRVVR